MKHWARGRGRPSGRREGAGLELYDGLPFPLCQSPAASKRRGTRGSRTLTGRREEEEGVESHRDYSARARRGGGSHRGRGLLRCDEVLDERIWQVAPRFECIISLSRACSLARDRGEVVTATAAYSAAMKYWMNLSGMLPPDSIMATVGSSSRNRL